MKTKLFTLWIIIFLTFSMLPPKMLAQTSKGERYPANLLLKKGTGIEMKSVFIAPENGMLNINGAKDRTISKSFPYASIKTADYAYSDKPQIKEAILLGLLTNGFLGATLLFNKTKKHWLVLEAETETVFLELQQESYRRLLFEMNGSGIKVRDLGDRDSKAQLRPKAPANLEEGSLCGESES